MSEGLTVTRRIHFSMKDKGKRQIVPGPAPVRDAATGRVPRISRLMALAIHFDGLMQSGSLGQADIARLGHVTRARVTQIMNMLHLAPDIQEQILLLPQVTAGDDPIAERHVRTIAAEANWQHQRRLWRQITSTSCRSGT